MPHDLPKAYEPTAIEDKWAAYWVRENLFAQPTPTAANQANAGAKDAEGDPRGEQPFTILLPPPNVTGRLHMGHMFEQTEIDILMRWHRMSGVEKGNKTLWVPGADHAGIATQIMVERQVVAEGTTRQALGREAFLARVWEWKTLYGGAILDQMKRLGASVDWHREYFTMDANLSVAVREAFVRLHSHGLIYRGAYIVNWCPSCQTAISDLEVVHEETTGKLWEIRYPLAGAADELRSSETPNDGASSLQWLTIATTRPETMLGDVAVAIHPEDERYLHLHGKKLLLPLGPGLPPREIPIVLDDWVSRDFGTGAVKITPAHDPNDFALGARHHLPSINIMDDTAHISVAGPYFGLDRYVARKRILEDLEAQGLLGKIHEHKLSIGRCDRSKDVVEPRLSTQWFVKIQPLADRAIQAVEEGHVKFTPDQYKKTYLNWMNNIHDWCISRQLWWGHRIPAWHCASCHEITVPKPGELEDPTSCAHCGSQQLTQESDVLDTWFSSGLLPISVFGWPNLPTTLNLPSPDLKATEAAPGLASKTWESAENRTDFDTFYPTSLLVTGFDILFFWVARMIMLGCWFAKDIPEPDGSPRTLARSVPFKDVYIHALVRDANREKMSKTKGNVIDPIEIVQQYGTDAVRFTLASMASPGTDIAFNVARTEGYRAFANKIWNAARFIFMNIDRAAELGISVDTATLGQMPVARSDAPLESRWIVAEFHKTAAEVNQSLANYRYDDAANTIYQFFWGSFCDWYLEIAKIRLDFSETADHAATKAALTTLVQVFEAALRLLSPFMPFITEEIWHAIYDGNPPARSVALATYPQSIQRQDELILINMGVVQDIVVGVRMLRKELAVPEKVTVPIEVNVFVGLESLPKESASIIQKLGRVSDVTPVQKISEGLRVYSKPSFDVAVIYEATLDVPAERDRLTKDIAKFEKGLASAERQLGNETFLARAPDAIVQGLKNQELETRLLLNRTKDALAALPPQE